MGKLYSVLTMVFVCIMTSLIPAYADAIGLKSNDYLFVSVEEIHTYPHIAQWWDDYIKEKGIPSQIEDNGVRAKARDKFEAFIRGDFGFKSVNSSAGDISAEKLDAISKKYGLEASEEKKQDQLYLIWSADSQRREEDIGCIQIIVTPASLSYFYLNLGDGQTDFDRQVLRQALEGKNYRYMNALEGDESPAIIKLWFNISFFIYSLVT